MRNGHGAAVFNASVACKVPHVHPTHCSHHSANCESTAVREMAHESVASGYTIQTNPVCVQLGDVWVQRMLLLPVQITTA